MVDRVRALPPVRHLSHLEIIIHHGSTVTQVCVRLCLRLSVSVCVCGVLFNGRH